MKLLDETLFSWTYSLLVILPVVLCRWDIWLFTWWEEYRMMVMSESRVWRTCWQGRQYCLLILCEHHSLLTFGRPQVQFFLLEANDPDWFFVVFLSPLSQMEGHCLKLGHSCFLPSILSFLPSFHILCNTLFANDTFFLRLYSLINYYVCHIEADFVFRLLKWFFLHLFR
jgi:hypothetical protein